MPSSRRWRMRGAVPPWGIVASMELTPRPMPTDARLLPLAGGAGSPDASCACCAPGDGGASRSDVVAETSVAEYLVAGMTCGNCVSHVTADLSALDGVRGVEVDLVAGGVSTVRVLSDDAIDPALIAEAVADGGYEVVPA